jgi:hypothetical protein
MPYLEQTVSEFEALVIWKKSSTGDEDIPEPREGLDQNFDKANY